MIVDTVDLVLSLIPLWLAFSGVAFLLVGFRLRALGRSWLYAAGFALVVGLVLLFALLVAIALGAGSPVVLAVGLVVLLIALLFAARMAYRRQRRWEAREREAGRLGPASDATLITDLQHLDGDRSDR